MRSNRGSPKQKATRIHAAFEKGPHPKGYDVSNHLDASING